MIASDDHRYRQSMVARHPIVMNVTLLAPIVSDRDVSRVLPFCQSAQHLKTQPPNDAFLLESQLISRCRMIREQSQGEQVYFCHPHSEVHNELGRRHSDAQ